MVFLGRNLRDDDTDRLYFQDAASFFAGERWESAEDGNAEFHLIEAGTPFVFEFERALDRLLYCSLTRRQG